MKEIAYYRNLIESLLKEQPDNNVPPPPNRADIESRKLAHFIKMRKWPLWLAYLKDYMPTSYGTTVGLEIPVLNKEILELVYVRWYYSTDDYAADNPISKLSEPTLILAYITHENISAEDSKDACAKIISQAFHTAINDCQIEDYDNSQTEIRSKTVDKIIGNFLATNTNIDSILEKLLYLKDKIAN